MNSCASVKRPTMLLTCCSEADIQSTHDFVKQVTVSPWLPARMRSRPGVGELLPGRDAFPEVKVDQRLITNACFLCQALEVLYCVMVEPNGHLLLQTSGIGVAFGFREVVMLPHRVHLFSYSSPCTYNVMRRQLQIGTLGAIAHSHS